MSVPCAESVSYNLLTQVERVTPAQARMLLQSDGNRPFRRTLALRYAESMKRGAWKLNGESIKIGRSGRLLDGQHRLHAVLIYGQPVEMAVTRGIANEEEAFLTMDSGSPRTIADRLYGHHEKNAHALAATGRWIYRYLWGPTSQKGTQAVNSDEMFELLETMPEVREVLSLYKGFSRAGFVGSMMCAVISCASRYDKELALRFANQCALGEGLSNTDPAFHLRSRVISDRSSVTKTPAVVMFALCIKAWNAAAVGADMKHLRYMAGKENFPEIVGFPSFAGLNRTEL